MMTGVRGRGRGIRHQECIVFLFLSFHNTHPSCLTPMQSSNRNLLQAYYVPRVLVHLALIHSPCWGWPGLSLLQSSVSTQKEKSISYPPLSPALQSQCLARSLAQGGYPTFAEQVDGGINISLSNCSRLMCGDSSLVTCTKQANYLILFKSGIRICKRGNNSAHVIAL